jgi:phosphoribosylcarboxyaminoimidazole (NCAIR) mutase
MTASLPEILMGSRADEDHSHKIVEAARSFRRDTVLRVGAAHKTTKHVLNIMAECEADPSPKVNITVVGRCKAFSWFIDGAVSALVIACPPPSDCLCRGRCIFFAAHTCRDCTGSGSRTGERCAPCC